MTGGGVAGVTAPAVDAAAAMAPVAGAAVEAKGPGVAVAVRTAAPVAVADRALVEQYCPTNPAACEPPPRRVEAIAAAGALAVAGAEMMTDFAGAAAAGVMVIAAAGVDAAMVIAAVEAAGIPAIAEDAAAVMMAIEVAVEAGQMSIAEHAAGAVTPIGTAGAMAGPGPARVFGINAMAGAMPIAAGYTTDAVHGSTGMAAIAAVTPSAIPVAPTAVVM